MVKYGFPLRPLAIVAVFAYPLAAAVHFVGPNATATWAQSVDKNTPCSLPAANTNASAGDTVHLLAGTYTNVSINPSRSGTTVAPIVYENHGKDSVTITNASYGIVIDGKAYVTVNGIRFYRMGAFLYIKNGAKRNTIGYCTFDKARDSISWGGSKIYYSSQYNRVHHCIFSRWGYANDENHSGALFDVGNEFELTDSSYYNLIEDNVFFYGGHHCLAAWSKYCIFRNNYLHHERSPAEGYGYRCAITHGKAVDRNLYEGNRFAFAYKASGMSLRSSNNIFRFNVFYANGLGGIQCVSMKDYTPAHYNRIYNNVFFNNGHAAEYNGFSGAIYFCDWGEGDPVGNAVKNNIFYKNKGGAITTDAVTTKQIVENNWESGDPLFVDDESPLDPFNPKLPDARLRAGSKCIDGGMPLTKTTGADGSGMRFTVEDAGYFTDGWGMIPGDEIRLERSTQKARITSIDYGGNTITVDKNLAWKQNQGVCLAYEGSAPDIGAYEYDDGSTVKNASGAADFSRIPSIRAVGNGRYEVGFTGCGEVCVFDLQGRSMRVVRTQGGMTTIDLNGLFAGAYVLRTSQIVQRTVFVR